MIQDEDPFQSRRHRFRSIELAERCCARRWPGAVEVAQAVDVARAAPELTTRHRAVKAGAAVRRSRRRPIYPEACGAASRLAGKFSSSLGMTWIWDFRRLAPPSGPTSPPPTQAPSRPDPGSSGGASGSWRWSTAAGLCVAHSSHAVQLYAQRCEGYIVRVGLPAGAAVQQLGLCGYSRARCYSSLTFLVTMGILHIKEIGEGQ